MQSITEGPSDAVFHAIVGWRHEVPGKELLQKQFCVSESKLYTNKLCMVKSEIFLSNVLKNIFLTELYEIYETAVVNNC